jgi:MbtH protein
MMQGEDDDTRAYQVVINDEEQYSIWLAGRDLPAGWRAEGTAGSRQECLEHIEKVWTDMRPLSLRRHMAETATG